MKLPAVVVCARRFRKRINASSDGTYWFHRCRLRTRALSFPEREQAASRWPGQRLLAAPRPPSARCQLIAVPVARARGARGVRCSRLPPRSPRHTRARHDDDGLPCVPTYVVPTVARTVPTTGPPRYTPCDVARAPAPTAGRPAPRLWRASDPRITERTTDVRGRDAIEM